MALARQFSHQYSREYCRQFFVEADKDGNGYLSFLELKELLRRKGYRDSDVNLRILFMDLDTSGDNRLSLDEFLNAMGALPEEDHKSAMLRCCFRAFDKNGDGKIDKRELDSAFLQIGKFMHPTDLEEVMRMADKDRSGTLDYEEFIAIFSKK